MALPCPSKAISFHRQSMYIITMNKISFENQRGHSYATCSSHSSSHPPSSYPSSYSSSSSFELITPRSNTESRVSETLHPAKLFELSSFIKPEPIPHTSLHETSPSLIQVESSPSRQHEDVVKAIKVDLEELCEGDVWIRKQFIQECKDHILVQVYHNIGTEKFDKLCRLLLEARIRYTSESCNDFVMTLIPILDLNLMLILKHWSFVRCWEVMKLLFRKPSAQWQMQWSNRRRNAITNCHRIWKWN